MTSCSCQLLLMLQNTRVSVCWLRETVLSALESRYVCQLSVWMVTGWRADMTTCRQVNSPMSTHHWVNLQNGLLTDGEVSLPTARVNKPTNQTLVARWGGGLAPLFVHLKCRLPAPLPAAATYFQWWAVHLDADAAVVRRPAVLSVAVTGQKLQSGCTVIKDHIHHFACL